MENENEKLKLETINTKNKIRIKSNQRVSIVGKTGSGKSYWCNKHIIKFNRVVFFDPKRQFGKQFKNAVVTDNLSSVKSHISDKKFFIVFQPFDVTEEMFNNLCEMCFKKGNLVLCLDEVENLPFVYWHEKIIRMGRIRGVGIWHLVQRPMDLPSNYILSESEHFILFKLKLKGDREKLKGILGDEAENLGNLKEFHYFYYYIQDDKPILCKPI